MGQIVSLAAKPKRCNLNQLSQVPTPAAGEHILVSSDNSMNAAGQGNFDCYIVGDGTTAATALTLHPLADETPTENSKNSVTSGGVYSAIKSVNNKIEVVPIAYKATYNGYSDILGTNNKYIKTDGTTASYSGYFISTPFEVKRGQCIRLTNFVCQTACSIAKVVNGSYTPIYTRNIATTYEVLHTITEDCTIVISGEKRAFTFTLTTYDTEELINTTSLPYNTAKYADIDIKQNDKIIVKAEGIDDKANQVEFWVGFTNTKTSPSTYSTFRFSLTATEIEFDMTADADYQYLYVMGHFSATIKIYDGNAVNILSDLESRVSALEDNTGEIDMEYPAMSAIASKTRTQQPKVLHNYLCLVHQSDIHNDATRMQRMIDFANKYKDRIDGIISTGDFASSKWSDQGFENTYVATLPSCEVLHFPVIGNHDIGLAKTIQNNSITDVGARFITPYMTQLGAVQGGTDAGYYYKDFSTYKVRLIVLCEYEMPRVPNSGNTELKYSIWGRYFTQEQANWLVSTLNSVQSDWYVIIAMHQIIDVFPKYDNEFKGTINYTNADVEFAQVGMLQDIIDAYISKGTLSKTYSVSGADSNEVPNVSVSADFTSANGEFICYINGHTHNDGTGQSSVATNKQVNINVTTGSANTTYQAIYDDLYRVVGERSEDAFDVLCFDTDRKEIRMLRIGANVNNQMKRRDYACIPFNQS